MTTGKESYVDRALERAWDLLDRGDADKALDLMAGVDSAAPRRWVVEAAAKLALDDLDGARAAMDKSVALGVAEDDQDFLWTQGELRLREWKVAEAEQLFERLAAIQRSGAVVERLSLCADLRHDSDAADRLADEAEALGGDEVPHPPRLSHAQFEHVIEEAVELLPREFQQALESTQILIERVPSESLIDRTAVVETPPDMLGLFVGASKLDETPEDAGGLPPTIYLFQRNLERISIDRDELINEIRVTLYHEIGHMLGFDEEGVAKMGLD